MISSSLLRLALAVSWIPLATACGTDALAGGQTEGEVRAVAVSQADASRSSGVRPAMIGLEGESAGAADPQGTVQLQAAVRLVTDAGVEVPVTNGVVPATVQISGADSARLGQADVEARTYSRVRVVFSQVSSNVTGGLVIGGTPISGEVRVQIAQGSPLVVERTLPVAVTTRSVQTLVVDLNAHVWLTAAVLAGLPGQGAVVPSAAFQSAVEVRVAR